jgi:hypothetical protein
LQGHFDFAPVPDNLPSTLLISAATGTIGLGLNGSKPKGAGSVQPSFADFITTGGIVAPERLQFLVWTILGVFTFLFLIISSDPASITALPDIPDKFLQLMGISSTGYLGGRLARKAGPVIDDILASISSLSLEIHGGNLHKDASFQIDGQDVTLDMLSEGAAHDHLPEVLATDDQAQDPNIAKVLNVKIVSPPAGWLTRKSNPSSQKREHLLSLINPDGQKADWKFAVPGPTAAISATADGQTATGGGTLNISVGGLAALDASATVPGDSPIKSYSWLNNGKLLGVGSTLPGMALVDGDLTLTVTDATGLSDSVSLVVKTVVKTNPTANSPA